MLYSRRTMVGLLAAPLIGRGQMSSRGVHPTAKGKASGLPFNAWFTDVAAHAGLKAPVIYGGVARNDYIVEAIGCGAAFLDYDNDGWLDIFLLSGTRWEGAPPGTTNRLYRNNRDGTFTDVTAKAGLERTGWACGVTVGDYNNDGFEDIFVTYYGRNILYRNNGDGTFTDVTRKAGLWSDEVRWSTGCTFVDYDRDGKLDLFVSRYLQFDSRRIPAAGKTPACNFKGVLVNCGPRGLPADTHSLYRNNRDGTFTEVSREAGITKSDGTYGLTAVAADFNDDGWPEIYVACDSTPSLLFVNKHDGTFQESGLELGVALNDDGQEQAGMGLGVGDFNLDGRIDLLKTHFSEDTPALYANQGQTGFTDVTIRSGLGVETRFVSWGAGIVDLDNNGYPDLFWVTGSVYPEVEKKLPQYPYRTPPILFRNLGGGRFEELSDEAGPALTTPHCSRGCAFGDFDNDGDIDVVVNTINGKPQLLRCDSHLKHNWIKIRTIGTKSNRSGIGARLKCVTHPPDEIKPHQQIDEVRSGGSYISQNDLRIHFGMGKAEKVDLLEIRWPSGLVDTMKDMKPNQLIYVKEGQGIVRTVEFDRERLKS
jgi:hypothetical protein